MKVLGKLSTRTTIHIRQIVNASTQRISARPASAWSKFVSWAYNERSEEDGLPPMVKSEHAHIRALAEQYKEGGRCPVVGCGKPLNFSCPQSGFLTHCSKSCYEQDGAHSNHVEDLKLIHEDLADLYSGRAFPEFQFSGPPRPGNIELVNWVQFFLDRKFKWGDSMRSARHLSQMFTWPLTVAYALQKVRSTHDRRLILCNSHTSFRLSPRRPPVPRQYRSWPKAKKFCPKVRPEELKH